MRESFSIRLSWVVAALFALSPLQALAANLTYSRQFYQPPTAGAARIPRTTASGGLHLLDQQSGPGLSNNQTTKIPNDATYASSTTMIDNKPYVLASATVTGGLQGAATVYSPLPAFIPVTVGTSDIAVTYLYLPVPVSGICPPPPQPCGGGGSQVVIDEASDDPIIQGARRFHEMLASERAFGSRVSATSIQTVGVKGYDGFTLALVTPR